MRDRVAPPPCNRQRGNAPEVATSLYSPSDWFTIA